MPKKVSSSHNIKTFDYHRLRYVYPGERCTFLVLDNPKFSKYSAGVKIFPLSGTFYDAKRKKFYDAKELRKFNVVLNVDKKTVAAEKEKFVKGAIVEKKNSEYTVVSSLSEFEGIISQERDKLNVNKKPMNKPNFADYFTQDAKIREKVLIPSNSVNNQNDSPMLEKIVKGSDGSVVIVKAIKKSNIISIKGDKVIESSNYHFQFYYKDKLVAECDEGSCNQAIVKVHKETNKHIAKKDLKEALNEIKNENMKEYDIVEYAQTHFKEEFEKMRNDVISWLYEKTNTIVGQTRLKLLTFLSAVSSVLPTTVGISRLHLILVGSPGTGKTSILKSVLRLFPDDMVLATTRLTEKALGYFDVETFDGKILFLEQLDNMGLQYLRESLSESQICTYVTIKNEDTGEFKTRRVCVEGQPVFVSTSVSERIDLERDQIYDRVLSVYVKPELNNNVYENILNRLNADFIARIKETEDIKNKILIGAFVRSLPRFERIDESASKKIIDFIKTIDELNNESHNRTLELFRNLAVLVALIRGKSVADVSDVNFVLQSFKFDLLFNALHLTERDIELLHAVGDGERRTVEVAIAIGKSKLYTLNRLNVLFTKGLVDMREDASARGVKIWSLTSIGRQILELVKGLDNDNSVIATETGMAGKEFFRNDRTRNSENAMLDQSARAMRESNGEVDPIVERGERESEAYVKVNNDKRDDVNSPVNMKLADMCAKFDGREISDDEYANETPKDLWICLHKAYAYVENTEDGRRIYRFITN